MNDNEVFTYVLRKDVYEMRARLQTAFNCLVRLDQDMSQKLNGEQYQRYIDALNNMDTVFRKIEFYELKGDYGIRERVKKNEN